MASPYDTLDPRAFWRSGVAEQSPQRIEGLYRPKFAITPETKVMTAGSCFAQHVHRNLVARGWAVIDTETPAGDFPAQTLGRFGYGLYSARYGNVYTARQMAQLLSETSGKFEPQDAIWEKAGRFYDALRPSVEPDGLESADHVQKARTMHLRKIRRALEQADVFVFTLGLTEVWQHSESGTVFPTAPGVIAGKMSDAFSFHNFSLPEVTQDLAAIRSALKTYNPEIKMLLTVSPVPLTATATNLHVLPATHHSKAVLRGAAGAFAMQHDDVDYFPSFELITGPQSKGAFYAANLRSVKPEGVSAAMDMFFSAHEGEAKTAPSKPEGEKHKSGWDDAEELICEDALLEQMRYDGGAS